MLKTIQVILPGIEDSVCIDGALGKIKKGMALNELMGDGEVYRRCA
jgi:hypothetical protein